MSDTLYKKVVSENGKVSYIPVKEYSPELVDSLPVGTHLITVLPGSRSRVYDIDPDYATMVAAFKMIENDFIKILMEKAEMRPKEQPITDKQRDAWHRFREEYGDNDLSVLYGPSMYDVAQQFKDLLVNRAASLLEIPAVKIAWDKYQQVVVLAK